MLGRLYRSLQDSAFSSLADTWLPYRVRTAALPPRAGFPSRQESNDPALPRPEPATCVLCPAPSQPQSLLLQAGHRRRPLTAQDGLDEVHAEKESNPAWLRWPVHPCHFSNWVG